MMAVLRNKLIGYSTLALIIILSLMIIASVDARERDVERDGRDVIRTSESTTDNTGFNLIYNTTRISETIVEEEISGGETVQGEAEGAAGGDGRPGSRQYDLDELYQIYLEEQGITDGSETISRRDTRLDRSSR